MQHKCKSHSEGSGAGAIAYLKGLKDSKGQIRAGVEVVRGNPELTAELIDSLKTKHRYVSSVIAWAHEDAPTDDEIQAVLDDWERVAFAGLRKSQYTFCAVLHIEDDGSKHIHLITPRVCLESGRSLNIAPPGHEYYFARWRNVWNHEKGWARPDDPSRARLVQPGVKAYQVKAGKADPKEEITSWLIERVAAGEIESRLDVLEALAELGEITRTGKDYVSVRLEADAKPIRLKGILYGDNFSPELVRETGAAAAARPAGRARPDPAAAAAARVELAAAIDSRTRYNQERYSRPERGAKHSVEGLTEGRESERGRPAGPARPDAETPALADAVAPAGNVPAVPADAVQRDDLQRVDSQPGRGPGEPEAAANPADRGDVLRDAGGPESLQNTTQEPVKNDGVGNLADEAIERAKRAARAAAEAASRAANAASRAAAAVVAACRKVDRAMPVMSANQGDELERFKREINLVEVAQSMGYELVKAKSTKASKVMRSGGDIIVIATDASDGHGIYFSIGDDGDNGSVIDFYLRRTQWNLGQIRKELRGWMPAAARPSPKRKPPAERPEPPQAVTRDRAEVLAKFAALVPYSGRYLTNTRKVDQAVIEAFGVLQDGYGNACFVHRDDQGVGGWETKNKGFTGFSAGGEKGLFLARPDSSPIVRIVVAEAAIDLMSWAQFKHAPGTVYASTGGSVSPEQLEQLRAALARNPGAEIVLAHDGDAGGDWMADQVRELAPPGATVTRDRPPEGLDWNEVLKQAAKLAEQREKGPGMHR